MLRGEKSAQIIAIVSSQFVFVFFLKKRPEGNMSHVCELAFPMEKLSLVL